MANFVFKNGENVVYDSDVDVTVLGNKYIFSVDSEMFEVELKGNKFISLTKVNNDSIFEIKECEDRMISTYTLKEQNFKFDIELLDFEYKIEEDKYIIKYLLSSEEESPKSIILSRH